MITEQGAMEDDAESVMITEQRMRSQSKYYITIKLCTNELNQLLCFVEREK